ncbi:hypothetical protein [Encephalitozoon cuniculi GB-M1]|uniref:Uncharacterized protein n=1 Tax=Encephalitozoon cuniculi (strain GB-M1) TaxID=284813 RepID=Q8STY5_ENCCU|nr:uncharacterized protein ECU09_0050 [Encephalitozoon cuniculi GB-M1]CAD26976.1 hypothetical protein [Encephalitozoon cuniculi GB-M1]
MEDFTEKSASTELAIFDFLLNNERIEALILIGFVLIHLGLNKIEAEGVLFHLFNLAVVIFFVAYMLCLIKTIELPEGSILGALGIVSLGVTSVIAAIQAICSMTDMRNDKAKIFYSQDGVRLVLGGYAVVFASIFILVQMAKMLQSKRAIKRKYFTCGCLMVVASTTYFLLSEGIDREQLLSVMVCLALAIAIILLLDSKNDSVSVENKGATAYVMTAIVAWFTASVLGAKVVNDKVKFLEKLAAVVTLIDKAMNIR